MVTTYDPACETLAEHFLGEELAGTVTMDAIERHARRLRSLSLAIQQAVEDWCEDNPLRPEP